MKETEFLDYQTMSFPINKGLVYIIGISKNSEFFPIYVGESSRNIGRCIGDYLSANFSASTDFKVGIAVKYLNQKGFNVLIKYKNSSDIKKERVKEQNNVINTIKGKNIKILNDLKGYNYKIADTKKEADKIKGFINDILDSL